MNSNQDQFGNYNPLAGIGQSNPFAPPPTSGATTGATHVDTVDPTTSPVGGILYWINASSGSAFYWNGSAWVLQASGSSSTPVHIDTVDPTVAPTGGILYWINSTNNNSWYWTGSAWVQQIGQ
jgi:hypothetical protein